MLSQSTPAGQSTESVNKLAAILADVHAALALATNELESLAAVMRYIDRFRPMVAQLYYLQMDEHGRPDTADLVGLWAGGSVLADYPGYHQPYRLSDLPTAALWIDNPHDFLALEDLLADTRCDDAVRAEAARNGHRAMVILPLYSQTHHTWQGLLRITWNDVHVLSAEECFVYALLMQTLAAFIANRRSQLAQYEALEEVRQLYEVSAQLNMAQTLEAALRAAAAPSIARGAQSAFVCVLERDAAGEPTNVFLAAGLAVSGPSIEANLGARIPIRGLPLAQLWLLQPDEPILIGDIETDPRVDPQSRAMYQQSGRRATALLPLVAQQRILGIISISWGTTQRFSMRDHRHYLAIAKNAALILDNRLLVERMEKTLQEKQQQSALLQAVLDHLPVGVAVAEAPSGKPLLSNRKAVEVLGRQIDPQATKEQYSETYHILRSGTDIPLVGEELPLVRTLTTGEICNGEMDAIGEDGQRRTLDATAAPILDERGVMRRAVVLMVDITRRKQADQERLRMQDELIRFQAAALAERSTPLIPISDEIVVVPIIGSLDTERGNQLMDALLQGVSQNRARVAIIDITGVKTLDTQAAGTLTSAAQSLRLLGVEPVLTGIRAEVAQTLVTLGVHLDRIVTRNNLQNGIAYALKFTGKSSLKS